MRTWGEGSPLTVSTIRLVGYKKPTVVEGISLSASPCSSFLENVEELQNYAITLWTIPTISG